MNINFWPKKGALFFDDIENFAKRYGMCVEDYSETLSPDEPKPDKYMATVKFTNERNPYKGKPRSIEVVYYKEQTDFDKNLWLPSEVYWVGMKGFKNTSTPIDTYFRSALK